MNILGAETEILGAHTINQHANQIFPFLHVFTVLLIHILIIDAEITMCCFKFSHMLLFIVSHFIYPNGMRVCVRQARKCARFTGVRLSSLHGDALADVTNASRVKSPLRQSRVLHGFGYPTGDPHILGETGEK